MYDAYPPNVTITHPDGAALVDTPMGPHRFEVYRAAEGRPELLSASILRVSDHAFALLDAPPSRGAVVYAARVIDPLGRPSPFALSATL
ncbi:MAG TPA: hypothetical protein VLS89_18155 [Candidatus Nanopelagicales bacterium]|nr:hypothetical protein [Candidatus Nanopelagicales bacterium]